MTLDKDNRKSPHLVFYSTPCKAPRMVFCGDRTRERSASTICTVVLDTRKGTVVGQCACDDHLAALAIAATRDAAASKPTLRVIEGGKR